MLPLIVSLLIIVGLTWLLVRKWKRSFDEAKSLRSAMDARLRQQSEQLQAMRASVAARQSVVISGVGNVGGPGYDSNGGASVDAVRGSAWSVPGGAGGGLPGEPELRGDDNNIGLPVVGGSRSAGADPDGLSAVGSGDRYPLAYSLGAGCDAVETASAVWTEGLPGVRCEACGGLLFHSDREGRHRVHKACAAVLRA